MSKKAKQQVLGTTLKKDYLFLIIISAIVLILYFNESTFNNNLFRIIDIAVLVVGYVLAKKSNVIAGYIGLVCGLLMVLTILHMDFLDTLLGLVLLVHSIKFLNNYNNQKSSKK